MPLGMAGGIVLAMVLMLVVSIVMALYVICKDYLYRNDRLLWIFGTMAIELLILLITMKSVICCGIPS